MPIPARPWFQVSDELGGHDAYNHEAQLARWLTYTHANMLAFDEATIAGDTRAAVDYLHRAIPAFTAAALTRGETPEWAYEVGVMGDTGEITWDWLTVLGIDPDSIAPATDAEAERRGAVKALRAMANELAVQNQSGWAIRLQGHANRIESGEVTL